MKIYQMILGASALLALSAGDLDASDLHWSKDVKTAIQAAEKSKQLIMMDFTAKW